MCVISKDRYELTICTFTDNIYVIGDRLKTSVITKSCFVLETSDYKVNKIKRMNEVTTMSASTSFKVRLVVVSGGLNQKNG